MKFKLVAEEGMRTIDVGQLVSEIEDKIHLRFQEGEGKFSEYVEKLNAYAKSRLPEGTMIAFERRKGITGEVIDRVPYILQTKVSVSGQELQDAMVQYDPTTQRPEVGFQFNPKGASEFEKLTGENIGKRLAVVLDNIVHSAAVIQSRIG